MTRNYIKIILVIVLLSIKPTLVSCQWQRTSGPAGGALAAIVADANVLYAAIGESISTGIVSGGDVYRSMDLGTSWVSIGSDIPGNMPIYSLAVNSKAIYCGTRNGLYRRMKAGKIWDSIGPNVIGGQVKSILVSDSDIIAVVRFGGIFRSTNDGSSWTKLNTTIPASTEINALDRVGFSIFVATQGKGIFRSQDNGINWQEVNDKITGEDLYVSTLYHINGFEFAGTLRGAFNSRDGGTHWDSCRSGLPSEFGPSVFASEGTTDSTLYANLESMGIFSSTDFGANWQPMNKGLAQFAGVSGLAVTSGMVFTGLGISGVVRAKTKTRVWENANYGIGNTSIFGLRVFNLPDIGNILFAGALDMDFGLGWHTTDKGVTWTSIDSMTNMGVIDFESKDGKLFAGSSGGGVFISDDNGIKWKNVNLNIPGASYVNSITTCPGAVLAGISGNVGVIRTTDLGKTWTTPLIDASAFINRVFYDSVTHTVFAGSNFGFFTSMDDGASWHRPKTSIDSATIFSFARIGNALIVGTWFGIYRSTDNGVSWEQTYSTQTKIFSLCTTGNVVYASTKGNVLISHDNGVHWQPLQTGLPASIDVISLASDGHDLFAGTAGYGVWKTPLEATNIVGEFSEAVNDLRTIYSNGKPFLSYTLPSSEYVKLSIVNVAGMEIYQICNELQSAGKHEYLLSDEFSLGVPAGIYFALLQNGNVLQSSKFLIMR